MVKNILNFIHREVSGLHQAAYLLGFFAICSQILALFRDRMLASHFGAGGVLDLYYSAFRIPDILFATVAPIVSVSVLIPFLIERMEKGEGEAREFLDSVFSFFFLLIVIIASIAFLFAPFFLARLFPSFVVQDTFQNLVLLTRIMLLSPIFLGLSNLLGSITQISRRFFLYAISPVFYNLGIIFGILFLYPFFGLSGLGFGVALGAFLHFAIQIPSIAKQGMFPKFRLPDFGVVKKIIFTSFSRTITLSSNEIAELFLISTASFFVSGSISVFNFSWNLQSVPLSVIGVSYAMAAFPTLTRLFSNGNTTEFVEQMSVSARAIIFWSVPVSVLFIVLRAQIVRTLLGAGHFNWDDTRLTAAALALFAVSLVAQSLIALFVRSYYSQGKTRTPLFVHIISALIIIISSLYLSKLFANSLLFREFFESLFRVSGISGTAVLMLPLGFSIGVLFNLLCHWIDFHSHFPKFSRPVLRTLFQSSSASIVMGFVTYRFLDVFDVVFNINTLFGIFFQGFLSGITGIIVAIFILYLLGNKELYEVWSAFHRKFWKTHVIAPDAELG